jgi:hypothetical protein
MGNSGSTKALDAYYERAIGKHLKHSERSPTAIVTGGAVSGGYSALEEYGNSVYSKAKEDLIRGIAKDLTTTLQLKSDYAETAPIKDVVEKLKRVVPDPRNKKNLKNDSTIHKTICEKLAKSINNRYGIDIIDQKAPSADICQKVSEIMHSLFTGLHTEFLTVSGDVSRIVKNLQILQEYVDAANNKLIADLGSGGPGGVSVEVENIRDLYKKLTEEIHRQHALLTNLTNSVIGPLGKSLITILEDNKDFIGLTQDLKNATGTTFFGEKLSYLLSGISDVSHAAELVDKALKQIGMSVVEYKNVRGLRDLRDKVYNSIIKKKPSTGELHKLLTAADILYRNDMAHDDIAAYLASKKGGLDISEPSFASMVDDATWQDTTETPFKGRTQAYRRSVSKQLQEQTKYRNLIFSDFNNQVRENYQNMIHILEKISKKIGTDIPASSQIERFIRLLVGFATTQPNKKNLHIALSGVKTDAVTNVVKFRYMDYLNNILEESNALARERGGELFKQLAGSILGLIKLIDDFNQNFTNALTDIHLEISPPKPRGAHVLGGADSDSDADDMGEYGGKRKKQPRKNNLAEDVDEFGIGEGAAPAFEEVEEAPVEEAPVEEAPVEERGEEEKTVGGIRTLGGGASAVLGGILANFHDKDFVHFVSLKRTINKMDYYFKIANIKVNLRNTYVENEENVKNYENVLGEEAGHIIDRIQQRYSLLLASAEGNSAPQFDEKKLYLGGLVGEGNINPAAGFESLKAACDNGLEKQLSGYKFLLEYVRQAKIEMIEAAQALDLYLSKFTRNVEMKPDSVQNFVQIVEQLEIVAKWFTNKSGDNFAAVFEAFDNTPLTPANLNGSGIGNADNAKDQNAAGNVSNNLSTPYAIANHYYANLDTKNPGLFYKPRLMTREEAISFVKQIEKSIKSVRALENIVALFTKINVHDQDGIKTFMSSGLMFKAFMKYCVASVISIGYRIVITPAAAGPPDNANLNIPIADSKVNFNVGADIADNPQARAFVRMAVGLRFNKEYIKVTSGQPANTSAFLQLCDPLEIREGILQGPSVTDKIFEMCVKSMISKIFTVVGSYSLFARPAKSITGSDAMSNSALRQIMGGSQGGYVRIAPEAAELYLRLPLLVEWYRTVFEFNNDAFADEDKKLESKMNFSRQGKDPVVSIVPEMDNIWGTLCKVIFIEGKNIGDGSYPSEFARKIIESITNIYNTFKSKKRDIKCKEIIEEFVLEINRRYGFMMRNEINEYLKAKQKNFAPGDYSEEDFVEYDILDSENQFGRGVAPSDKFRRFAASADKTRSIQWQEFNVAVRRFRHSIEQNLLIDNSSVNLAQSDLALQKDLETQPELSLNDVIFQTQKRLNKAATDEERYKIIFEQLHGVDKFGELDQNKLIAFHETVITPLTILYFTYLIVNNYNRFMVSMNLEEFGDAVGDLLRGEIPARGVNPNGNGDAKSAALGNNDVGANIVEGHQGKWLALALMARNNEKFKGSNNLYKLPNDDYKTTRESFFSHGEVLNYFLDPNGNNNIPISPPGYLSALVYNINDTKADAVGAVRRAAIIRRLVLNRSRLMEDTLRHIMNIACDLNGLVDVSFSGQGKLRYPIVSFDKLEEVCNALFQSMKSSLSKLRKTVPFSIINEIERFGTTAAPNVVSVFWLQENLFDRLFKNKFGNGLTDANLGLKGIWTELTREHEFNWILAGNGSNVRLVENKDCKTTTATLGEAAPPALAGEIRQRANANRFHQPGCLEELAVNATEKTVSQLKEYRYDSYGDVISKLAFWDVTTPENKVANELGFRTINITDELNQFPAHYIPIYRSGGTYGIPKIKDEREKLNAMILMDDNWGPNPNDSKVLFNYDTKVLQGFVRASDAKGVDVRYNWMLGAHNLYDYNPGHTNLTSLEGKATGDIPARNLGGPDKLAPGVAAVAGDEYNNLHRKLGLLPKLNNILYNYVRMFIDPTTKKIYRPLLEKLVNGYSSKDILQSRNINDRVVCRFDFGVLNELKAEGGQYPAGVDATRGAVNGRVAQPNDLGDMISAVCQLEPPEQAVLFASLANGIKGLMTLAVEKTSGNAFKYVEDNFANISEYQKEMMRAYLPIFQKQLEMLIMRAEFLKQVVENTSCKVYKWKQHNTTQADRSGDSLFNQFNGNLFDVNEIAAVNVAAAAANRQHIFFQTPQENSPTYTQPLRVPGVEYEGQRKTYLINMLSDVSATAKTLSGCIRVVTKELADIPLFFETYKDSIIDYNNRNGHLPLMPLSTVTHLMNFNLHRLNKASKVHEYKDAYVVGDEAKSEYNLALIPGAQTGVGSTIFKFAYGVRGVLNPDQKPSADYAPGIGALLSIDGGARVGGAGFDKTAVNELVSNSIILSRFVLDYQYQSQFLDCHRFNIMRDLMARTGDVKNLTCQTGKGAGGTEFWRRTENVSLLAENDNYKQSVYRMISCLRSDGGRMFSTDRRALRVYNILDLNIVPINVHALQREIPFINLMNYSYTFDHIVKDSLGVAYKNLPLSSIHGFDPEAKTDAESKYLVGVGDMSYSDAEYGRLFHPEDALVRHLIYPNGLRRLREYVNFSYKIMAGDTSLGINRPKFLSDQLWNKVLLNSLYDQPTFNTRVNGAYRMRSNEARRVAELKQIKSSDLTPERIVQDIIGDAKFMAAADGAAIAAAVGINAAITNPAPGFQILADAHADAAFAAGGPAQALPFIRALLRRMIPAARTAANAVPRNVANYRQNVVYEILRSLHNQYFVIVAAAVAGNPGGAGAVADANAINIFGTPQDFIGSLHATGRLAGLGAGPGANNAANDYADAAAYVGIVAMAVHINDNISDFAVLNQENSGVQLNDNKNPVIIDNDANEPLMLGLLGFARNANGITPTISGLSYQDAKNDITEVNANPDKLQQFALEGYLRYNSKFVRWTEWFVHLQRVARILMRNQLEWMQDPVVLKHDALSENVTEYRSDNKGFQLDDFE